MKSFLWQRVRQQGYITPLLITSTYLILVVLPNMGEIACLVKHRFNRGSVCLKRALSVWFIGWNVNNFSDAVVYIFFDRDIRRYLQKCTKVKRGSAEEVEITGLTVFSERRKVVHSV